MNQKYNREDTVLLLQNKQRELRERGETRYPRRTDFTGEEVVAIKALLGPWPRALECAGLKAPRDDGKAEKTLQKRIRAKRRRIALLKQKAQNAKQTKTAE